MPWYKRAWHGLLHHLHIWRLAWRHENSQPKKAGAKGKELEFLPAVLEIQETPASPVGRTIGGLVILLFVIGVVWASFGRIDIVATAQGKVIPSGRSKVIQPLDAGIIKVIHVHEGQYVKTGDVLIELDTGETIADEARLKNELTVARLDFASLRVLLTAMTTPEASLSLTGHVEGIAPERVAIHEQLITNRYAGFKARLAALESSIVRRRAEQKTLQLNITKLKETLPLVTQRAASLKKMLSSNVVAENTYLEIEQERIEKERELMVAQQQLEENWAAIEQAIQERRTLAAEFHQTVITELKEAKRILAGLEQEYIKAQIKNQHQHLRAPVDGVVQQLSVHTIGGVVTPAQELMVIVPNENALEVTAWVENRDIGWVYEGQLVEVKLEAFPFTRYGTINGKVVNLSDDAVPVEDIGYVYAARISLDRDMINVGPKQVRISPGMNATVEIKTGKRRLIEFFLTPILRGFQESARER